MLYTKWYAKAKKMNKWAPDLSTFFSPAWLLVVTSCHPIKANSKNRMIRKRRFFVLSLIFYPRTFGAYPLIIDSKQNNVYKIFPYCWS